MEKSSALAIFCTYFWNKTAAQGEEDERVFSYLNFISKSENNLFAKDLPVLDALDLRNL
jgi:hypothetical protein